MEVVTVKFQKEILKRIDDSLTEHNFNSRTEFIREAVRDKFVELNKGKLIAEFMALRGKAKKKTTYKENLKTKHEVGEELFKELEQRFKK
ncbi:MAG: ribbon-helix-helix domain-containing protein [Candidatus Woesearchaeota archaeon]|nr:ribbon-helix-helix domain-containing protein [Candidatus Woesearchaeota archaeon]